MPKALPSADFLSAVLAYDPVTGEFFWNRREDRSARWNSRYAGTRAGTCDSEGYVKISIDGTAYAAHRIAWKLIYKTEPPAILDHENRDRGGNSIVNIRAADDAANQYNTVSHRDKRDELPKGVDFHTPSGKFRARISVRGHRRHLGWFDDPIAAAAAYRLAASQSHGQFARFA